LAVGDEGVNAASEAVNGLLRSRLGRQVTDLIERVAVNNNPPAISPHGPDTFKNVFII
jgi:hypothetical protein